jgi:hypothetical protein
MAGCSSGPSISYDYDSQASFDQYKSFGWLPQPVNQTSGDARQAMQSNTLLQSRIRNAVTEELKAKGLTVDVDAPDLYAVYHTGVQNKTDIQSWGYGYGPYWGGMGSTVDTVNWEEGTIIIDLIDASTKQLVWRGTAVGAIDEGASPEKRDQAVKDVCAEIMAKYPPAK